MSKLDDFITRKIFGMATVEDIRKMSLEELKEYDKKSTQDLLTMEKIFIHILVIIAGINITVGFLQLFVIHNADIAMFDFILATFMLFLAKSEKQKMELIEMVGKKNTQINDIIETSTSLLKKSNQNSRDLLDICEQLEGDNSNLKKQLRAAKGKRGPGRPKKVR